ncbi:membrane-associated protein, putative [Bodo saltans]|uniref:Membrane-associated protein, putative n=1 Tax=Bodo saltans TaxID=75058 RepID=A0A0S4ILG3_BODSA|nr:membrane-associated protein, putative [Bodo saltans]|eukprot:CUE70624.1 membrane-associated protein, putative [Bodo saltans]
MAINGTTTSASVLALLNFGYQVGVLSGISTVPAGGAAKPHTNTTSSSATSSHRNASSQTQSFSNDLTAPTHTCSMSPATFTSTYTSSISASVTKSATSSSSFSSTPSSITTSSSSISRHFSARHRLYGATRTFSSSFSSTPSRLSSISQSIFAIDIFILDKRQLQLAQAVKSAGGYLQLISGLVGGTSSGTALGRVMATRNIALCDAGSAVIGGAIDLGIVICAGDDGNSIAARNTIISNMVLIAIVASLLVGFAVLWKFVMHSTYGVGMLECRLPSSLLPILTAALPSTASSTTYLLSNLRSTPCMGTDIVLSVFGAVTVACVPSTILLFWVRYCRDGSQEGLTCGQVKQPTSPINTNNHRSLYQRINRTRELIALLLYRGWRWGTVAPRPHGHRPHASLALAWPLLLEYKVVWFASLDLTSVVIGNCFSVVSGLDGVSWCESLSVTITLIFLLELVLLCLTRPFTTLFSTVQTATSLALTVISLTTQTAFVFLNSTSFIWLADISAICDILIISVSAIKTLVDAREMAYAGYWRVKALRGHIFALKSLTARTSDSSCGLDDPLLSTELFVVLDADIVATAQSDNTVHPLLIFDNGSNVCESNEFMEASPLQELEQFWNSDGSARIPANHDNSKVTTLHELHVSSHTKYNFAAFT